MKQKKSEEVYVALLRGVNVGGNHILPMKELVKLFEAAGCSGVKTYIQSGNVVFRVAKSDAVGLPVLISKRIREQFGFDAPVVMRSADELSAIAGNNPFLAEKADPKMLHVMFLGDEPDLTDVVGLDPVCVDDEAFSVRGREIFFYCPNGVGRSKLMTYNFGGKLRTQTTARNWQTVLKLAALCEELRPVN